MCIHQDIHSCNKRCSFSAALAPAAPAAEDNVLHHETQQDMKHKHKKRKLSMRKCVRFRELEPNDLSRNETQQVHGPLVSSSSTFCEEENSKHLWFQRDEIRVFQLEARDYALGRPASCEETRGLERFDRDRVRNKKLALKCTLKASKCGYTGKDLATIAQECSKTARGQAFLTGCEDFCTVYHPTQQGLLSGMKASRFLLDDTIAMETMDPGSSQIS